MDDFNAPPGTKELGYLSGSGFIQVLPNSDLTLAKLKYEETEKEQDLPYSHLKHGLPYRSRLCKRVTRRMGL